VMRETLLKASISTSPVTARPPSDLKSGLSEIGGMEYAYYAKLRMLANLGCLDNAGHNIFQDLCK
jgi:hypothetical protein